MKILLYGFKSYNHWKKNITESVVEKVSDNKDIVKVVFPLRLNKRIFLKKIKETMPDLIIGLGQHENGDKFRIERKAINVKRKNLKSEPTYLSKTKPHHYFLSMILDEDSDSWHSYNAGDNVSNYSMYIISHFCKNIKFAFINIPKNTDLNKTATFVERKIKESEKKFMPKGEQSSLKSFVKSKK